ncbi:nucleotidyltransferase family protein [Telmatospirillum sp. J64-1]|uniref:nucleotidyltransferase family protein n=1 Tax=Telmatospirillum sp. J64-1 TaxID=2502183 RepID=UPI00115E5309|nr:nucleotidyltransferase family protein [Telmatospirillum sp. J64-1]
MTTHTQHGQTQRGTEMSSPEAEAFYVASLKELTASGVPFLLGGTYAVRAYTGINRPTKDIDVFCKAGDYTRILSHFRDLGWCAEIEDERWLAKVHQGPHFFDVIFNSTTALTPVTEQWFAEARTTEVLGCEVQITPPTELVWSKAFIQNRDRYDGADVMHLILKQHDQIDWARLLAYMDQYWEVLMIHVLNFRFIYPSERDLIPGWVLDELLSRLNRRASLPAPRIKICRGRLMARDDYLIDVTEWGFADAVGGGEKIHEK